MIAVDAAPPAPPAYVVSLSVSAFMLGAISADVERYADSRTWSLVAIAGGRSAALGDYRSFTGTFALELRRWFFRPPRYAEGLGWGGPFAGARLSLGYDRISATGDPAPIGATWILGATGSLGYRFPVFRRFELTPSIDLGTRLDVEAKARVATWPMLTVGGGLTLGCVF